MLGLSDIQKPACWTSRRKVSSFGTSAADMLGL